MEADTAPLWRKTKVWDCLLYSIRIVFYFICPFIKVSPHMARLQPWAYFPISNNRLIFWANSLETFALGKVPKWLNISMDKIKPSFMFFHQLELHFADFCSSKHYPWRIGSRFYVKARQMMGTSLHNLAGYTYRCVYVGLFISQPFAVISSFGASQQTLLALWNRRNLFIYLQKNNTPSISEGPDFAPNPISIAIGCRKTKKVIDLEGLPSPKTET